MEIRVPLQSLIVTFLRDFFFQLLYLESGFLSVADVTLWQLNLAQFGILVLIVGPQSGFSACACSYPQAGLQVVTQSNHLLKYCFLQLVLNPHCSEIQPPKYLQVYYRCMPQHRAKKILRLKKSLFSSLFLKITLVDTLHHFVRI